MTELLCTRCKRLLPTTEFRASPRMRRGYRSWCRECHVDRTRQWRAEHRDAYNATTRQRYQATAHVSRRDGARDRVPTAFPVRMVPPPGGCDRVMPCR
jgi:hypothetical protein